jgi:hypothetical protein
MTFSGIRVSQIILADFDQALPSEVLVMAPMNDADGKRSQASHRRTVGSDVCAGQSIQEPTIVDCVAGKQGTSRRFPQPDRARRMSRQMKNFEQAVAEIDNVALINELRR